MKKITGILGVAAIAIATFFASNDIISTKKVDLASLISLNSANAETFDIGGGYCVTCGLVSYDVCITVNYKQYVGYRTLHTC